MIWRQRVRREPAERGNAMTAQETGTKDKDYNL